MSDILLRIDLVLRYRLDLVSEGLFRVCVFFLCIAERVIPRFVHG
jgi:hypothetical protein